ncbi:GDSL-type esterase/lipase family protein [Nodosilinea sp. E11]|uniref:GDSL-type esterase/lipase family protein n=1 Tax=Nodosilinea sp. E11 TaxID=3037479 RepID=UPI0029352AE6|nr:GDSL-type esterase/lipase family protein [Nodosilinea sp. E11]WOD41666.1 GDSL-type esterase/lipase family protein [Nodosilinea sp. E11]
MDIWLLAAQLLLGGAATPSAVSDHDLTKESATVAVQPQEAELDACATAIGTPEADCPRAQQVAAIATPPLSMTSVVTGWPSPAAVRTPLRPAPLTMPEHPPAPASQGRRPVTGAQLYQLRTATLAAGTLYTQVIPQRYQDQWQRSLDHPTYDQWQALLTAEAEAVARIQEERSLTVVVGDSIALWLPVDQLPPGQLWLNQSISGETTHHMLRRLHYFAATRPRAIHIMAGINDLKNGATEAEVVDNLDQMLTRLKRQHPQARLVVYSILPTRLTELPSDRIQRVNHRLAALAATQGATFIDLHPTFSDSQGQLRPELTTDGLHLSPQGYNLWRAALVSH